MPIFQLTPLQGNHEALQSAVEAAFAPGDRYPLQRNMGWLVRFAGTTVEVSQEVGITGQLPGEKSPVGSTMVTLIGGYYGRGPNDMWEWLKTRFESEQ